jgi:dolichol-phosphate mannosyltransferase
VQGLTVKLSVVIPARNEAGCIGSTVGAVVSALEEERIPSEILIVDDGSTDATAEVVRDIAERNPHVRLLRNAGPHGFGYAVRAGLRSFTGDAVAVMMADNSDSPHDLVRCYRVLEQGAECVFGSRFVRGGAVHGYPVHKLIINRLANWFIAALFGLRLNDVTNAFKCYRRHVIEGLQPLVSAHFNLTVEMPLKAIVRGYSYTVIPISWRNRATGISKLKLREMGSRYLFIVLYALLEKHLSRGDYRRPAIASTAEAAPERAQCQITF